MRDTSSGSERSIITVLSVDMVDSTPHIAACDPDDAQAFFDRWFDYVSGAIERAGGLLVNFGGDGGLAVFGWPSALEDHADRACAAAWDIQHPDSLSLGPDGTPVYFRVGIHSGLVGLRRLRRAGRAHFDTIGATVNIAAKLQQSAASGAIVVSDDAARLCRGALELTPQPIGTSQAIAKTTAFRLEARPDETVTADVMRRYRSPMVGRRKELDRLVRALRRPGRGASVALIGEAGIGKSRLAAAAIAAGLPNDTRVLVFYGDPQKRATPFAAARALITDLLHLHGAVSRERLRSALSETRLDESAVGALEMLLLSQNARRRAGAELTLTQIGRALAQVFRALAHGHPTLLLIEDLHLIDVESRQFLRLLARSRTGDGLSLLITGRSEVLDDASDTARTVIRLDPLHRNDMETLGRQLWPDGEAPLNLIASAVDRADGVPFVLEELLRSIGPGNAGGFRRLPDRVESVIHARLNRLSRSAKTVARGLSLLGEDVEIDFACAVLGRTTGTLLDDLSELERFAFVHPVAGHSIRFRHQIIAEACADTIPHELRRQLHRAAVEAIRSRNASLAGRYGQLAFHAEAASDDAAALGYLWEAGLEARRNFATASLKLIFDRAVGVIERLGQPAEEKYVDFVILAGTSLIQVGEFEKMNAHLPRARELARRHGQPAKVAGALSQLGQICWFEGRYEEGLQATEEGLEMARALASPVLIFANQFFYANVLHAMGKVERAIEVQRELIDMLTGELESARLGAVAMPRALSLAFLGWYMPDVGRYEEGARHCELAIEIALRERDGYAEVLARNALAHNLLQLGRTAEAVESLSLALNVCEKDGWDALKAHVTGRSATALSRVGRGREGVALVEAYLQNRLHLRTGQMEVYFLRAGYAEALARSGELERGLAALEEALAIARAISNPGLIVDGLGLRASLLSQNAPGDARIDADLAEQDELCERFALVAPPRAPWPTPAERPA
jgi:class 3 adenylate cyclase/tetratricopeptide (TPR) repeat protein